MKHFRGFFYVHWTQFIHNREKLSALRKIDRTFEDSQNKKKFDFNFLFQLKAEKINQNR